MECRNNTETELHNVGLPRPISVLADVAANGIPIGKNVRLVAKVEDLNHGEYKQKPAAIVGVSFEF